MVEFLTALLSAVRPSSLMPWTAHSPERSFLGDLIQDGYDVHGRSIRRAYDDNSRTWGAWRYYEGGF